MSLTSITSDPPVTRNLATVPSSPSDARSSQSSAKMLLSPIETARVLGMSKSKLYALWREDPVNAPPSFHIGKSRYCSLASLHDWIMKTETRARRNH